MRKAFKEIVAVTLFLIMIITTPMMTPISALAQNSSATQNEYGKSVFLKDSDYTIYKQKYSKVVVATEEVKLDLTQVKNEKALGELNETFEEKKNVLKISENTGYVEIPFSVEQPGLYNIGFEYYVLQGSRNDPEFKIEIDGAVPFSDANRLVLNRIWEDDGAIKSDTRGNQMRPDQKEVKMWQNYTFSDNSGIYNEPYLFNFTAGSHTLRIYLVRANIAITNMRIFSEKQPPKYEDYRKNAGKSLTNDINITLQAEKAYQKSSPVLFPIYDRSSSRTEPNDPAKILLNTIGSINWKYHKEWISWKIDVPKDGFYKLSFRVRQDIVRGMNSNRRLYIDGNVPFKEAQQIVFPFKVGWYEITPRNDQDEFEFFMTAGPHELKLEAVPGMVGPTLRNVDNFVYRLSALYRKIVVITGVNPDPNKDYYLDKNIPGLIEELTSLSKDMKTEAAYMDTYTKTEGSMASQITEIARQLDSYIDEPYTIQNRLTTYDSNIAALGTWLVTLREQPLEIDYIQVLSPDQKAASANENILQALYFSAKAFIYSFIVDYDSVGNVYDNKTAIKVWVPAGMSIGGGSGREQITIIKRLIDEKFTPESNIAVNLNFVDSTNTILQATFAGKGPDVALSIPMTIPVDWALRGALTDLSKNKDFETIKKEFYPSVFVPYEYQGGTYALPETQSFSMFFYRTDIFEDLGITAPDTWDEFYDIIPKLQKNNLQIGMPSEYNFNGVSGVSDQIFQTLLFQKKSSYYTKDLSATNFDTPIALDAFKEWTRFYSQYGFPLAFAFFNRFRTGEMPCGIMDYTMYNMFEIAAPEIKNLWKMVPIPGTKQTDGSINRTTPSNSMGSIIFAKSTKQEADYKLLKWWVSASTQAQYAKNLESLLGTGARYPVANKIAFEELPWSASEASSIKNQWEQTWNIPQIPGSYYVSRSLTNAFRKVVYNWQNERETLYDYSKKINEEILRKRTEFGLEGTKK